MQQCGPALDGVNADSQLPHVMMKFMEAPRRKKRISSSMTGLLAAACFFISGLAPAATTLPCGIYTVKVAGKPEGESQARTYLGVQLLPDVRFAGVVSSVNGNAFSIQFLGSHSALADPSRKLYVHVLDGVGKGFIADIDEFRPTDFLCSVPLSNWMSSGTRILIRPHSTLADLFGTANRFGLAAGSTAAEADNVVVWDPATQQEKVYYFHSGRSRWEEKDVNADASAAVFRFPLGCYLIRRSPGTLWMVLSGDIAADSVLLPVRTGGNVFSLPVNLSASLDQWITSSGDHAVIAGPNAKRADLLTFEEPSTGNQKGPFYRHPSGGGSWREVGVNDSTGTAARLDFLSTLILRREGNPDYVLANGSLEPGSNPPPPLDPEPGEPPLNGEIPLRAPIPTGLIVTVETSTDLQTWTPHAQVQYDGSGKLTFPLPAGQRRGFYRLNVTLD
jgi:hypothetical protein